MISRRNSSFAGVMAGAGAMVVSLLLASSAAVAASIVVSAETTEVIESGDFADAEFGITVTNDESVMATGVAVVFEDGAEVFIGDVAAGGSAVSAPQMRTIDLTAMPTRNQPFPVTLTLMLGGEYMELPAVLVVPLGTPPL